MSGSSNAAAVGIFAAVALAGAARPTNTYPPDEQPSGIDSIYPNRQGHTDPLVGQPNGPPKQPESTCTLAEDPVISYGGGLYHVLYDYLHDRVGYHLIDLGSSS